MVAETVVTPGVRVMLDTNVVLDLLWEREPWLSEAQRMWDARDAKTVVAYLPTVALTNIFYIGRKKIGHQRVMTGIQYCAANFELVPVDRAVVDYALNLSGADFEDNIQIACAVTAGVQFIVTRDPSGFTHAPIRAVAPPELIALLAHN